MTFHAATLLLERHFIQWRPTESACTIEALEEGTRDGAKYSEWISLPLDRMKILYWLGYCCPHC